MIKAFIFASTLLLLPTSSPALAQTATSESISNIDQIQVLERQQDLLNDVNGKILNTIYWALGGLITVFLAIVGLNFFQNFSLNKQRFDGLKKEVEAQVKEEMAKVETKNNQSFTTLSTKVESQIASQVKIGQQSLETKVQDLREIVNDLRRESLISKAFEYKKHTQLGYLINLTEVLNTDVKSKSWRLGESLELVLECLDTCYKTPDALAELQRVLNTLPIEYLTLKGQIEAKMKV